MSEAAAAVECILPDNGQVLDLRGLFGREAPLEVDLGCGDGAFLVAAAEAKPERNFLGIDRMVGRVRSACRKIAQRELGNVRILRAEIAFALDHLLPSGAVDAVHLMFSDPWPKRRHHRRRVVSAAFFPSVARVLKPGGVLRMVTDDAEYFGEMQRLAAAAGEFEGAALDDVPLPASRFEQQFRAAGATVHRLSLRKISRER